MDNKNNKKTTSGELPVEDNPVISTNEAEAGAYLDKTPMSAKMETEDTTVEALTLASTTHAAVSSKDSEGNGNSTNPTGETALQHVASDVNRLHLNKKKLSGAQKRKVKIQMAIAAGEPVKPRKKRSNRTSETKEPEGKLGPKRGRSEGSTPGSTSGQPQKKPKSGGSPIGRPSTSEKTGGSYSEALTALKMAITGKNYPEDKLTEEQSVRIQRAILGEIFKFTGGSGPQFKNSYFEKGVLFITCVNERARSWLMEVTPKLELWEGAVLKVGTAKDILKTTKVAVWVPTKLLEVKEPKQVLQLLKSQNSGLKTEDWRIINNQEDQKGTTLVMTIDETSMKVLNSMGLKLYLGLTQLSFKVLGRQPQHAGNSDKPATL